MDGPFDLSSFSYRNILVVDDEPALHLVFENCLQPVKQKSEIRRSDSGEQFVDIDKSKYNFNTFFARSGSQGLEICRAQLNRNSPIQVAFVDMRMKDWDGIDTIKHLQAEDPRINFAIVTGFPEDTQDQLEERLGAAALQILSKPVDLKLVYQTAYQLTTRWERLHAGI